MLRSEVIRTCDFYRIHPRNLACALKNVVLTRGSAFEMLLACLSQFEQLEHRLRPTFSPFLPMRPHLGISPRHLAMPMPMQAACPVFVSGALAAFAGSAHVQPERTGHGYVRNPGGTSYERRSIWG